MSALQTITIFALTIGYVVLLFGIFLMSIAFLNAFKYRRYKLDPKHRPTFSLIVPAHNEEKVVERTITRFLDTHYSNDKKEMIIVNDSSTDRTEEIVRKYAHKVINFDEKTVSVTNSTFKNIILINRHKGRRGKSYSLNSAEKFAKNDVLFFIDADIQINPDVFEKAARHFVDNKVGAVSGYVEVNSPKNFLSKLLDFEYVTGQKLLRRGFNVIGVHYIVPGGCAIIRRDVVRKIGWYHHDTLAEDTDLTWRIMTDAHKDIHFDPSIHVKADEPTKLSSLWGQRVRWARGNLEVTWKHKHKIGDKRYGNEVTLGFPFWISSMILPFAFMLSACAAILATTINVSYFLVPIIAKFIGISFIITWMVGTIINRGKSWLEGLLSPGLPMVISIFSLILINGGLASLIASFGFPFIGLILGVMLGAWILVAVPGTYLCMHFISKNNSKFFELIQLLIFGYWMFIITTIVDAYVKELFGTEKKWTRTER